jgi:hypothetical protein
MPMINVEYDNALIPFDDIQALSEGIRDVVSTVTGIEDVFTYTNSSDIKVKIAPVEIFIRMTASKIQDPEKLISDIKSKLAEWKVSSGFSQPINLTLIPENWKVEIGI